MRFRITFEKSLPVDICAYGIMVLSERRAAIQSIKDGGFNCEIGFCEEIVKVQDDHARDVFVKQGFSF